MALGIYVHLPFCPYLCPYCDFAKWTHRASAAARYLRALDAEIESVAPRQAATIFLGGGTPNTYDAGTIAALVGRLRNRFPLERGEQEITIELNAELVAKGDFEIYRAAGITRVSIGVQSFDRDEIRRLGRRHTPDDVERAVRAARQAGMRAVSVDLIFAVPGQSVQSWRRSIAAAVALGVDHISTYGLTIEEGTPFAARRAVEPGYFLDDAAEAQLYAAAMDDLEAAGFEQYEISNFARPGYRCEHNENYWANGEYLGLGVGAASYDGGVRGTHTRDLGAYVAAALAREAIPGESESLEPGRRAGEAIMLALRTSQGLRFAEFKERYGIDAAAKYEPVIRRYVFEGLLECDERGVRLSRRGRFFANDICAAFLEAPAFV
ncbi:MAG: radical SAM family heme chaperone HemW [Candidatus Tyrphobacter sp.]